MTSAISPSSAATNPASRRKRAISALSRRGQRLCAQGDAFLPAAHLDIGQRDVGGAAAADLGQIIGVGQTHRGAVARGDHAGQPGLDAARGGGTVVAGPAHGPGTRRRVMGQTLLDQLRQKRIARIFPPWLVNGSRGRGADVGAGA
jgi:hypothetical protein